MIQSFILEEKKGEKEVSLEIKGAVLCGYTGRDQSAVKRHIEELKKEGVKPPPSVPTFYPKPPQGIVAVEVPEVAEPVEVLQEEPHIEPKP